MKTANRWLADNVYSLKGVTESSVREIQADALRWASEQIVEDGNPAFAREKISRKLQELNQQAADEFLRKQITPTPEKSSAVQSVR